MNEEIARNIMGFDIDQIITLEICKKKYKKMALKYHPDKNTSVNASLEFIKISEAYNFLSSQLEREGVDIGFDFDSAQMNNEYNELVYKIISKIMLIPRENIVSILKKVIENIETDILIKIYDIIMDTSYYDIFNIQTIVVKTLRDVIDSRRDKNISNIYLYPEIDDLFDEQLYKLSSIALVDVLPYKNGLDDSNKHIDYIVPLWHHELFYDDICVKCIPKLCDNIHIDRNNNIIVYLEISLDEILDLDKIEFNIGKRSFSFERNLLKMEKKQIYKLKDNGIPQINKNNIFDVSKKGGIFVCIRTL
jgi:hypothetical protein